MYCKQWNDQGLIPCILAICALSPSSENCYIAYPSRSSSTSPFTSTAANATASGYASGDVEIFDALNIQLVNIVQAHKSPVSCITMNSEGTLLATASEKVIWSIVQGGKEFFNIYMVCIGHCHSCILGS